MVTSNFQERFNWDKTRKNKGNNQSNAFHLPCIAFFRQSSRYQIWKVTTYSILTNSNRLWTTTVAVIRLNFYDPTDSEHKFHKTKIENWLSTGFELDFPWLGTYSHNHYTMFSMMGSHKLLYTHLQSLGTILETLQFP